MESSNQDVTPDMIPLLDVVFQLIMFFMVTMSFIQLGQANPGVLLPVAQAATPLDQKVEDWVFLNLDQDGKLVGTSEPLDTESQLKAFLQRERLRLIREALEQGKKEEQVNVVVVLRAHKDVPYRRVYEVLDSCSRAGYRSWQLRVKTTITRRS